MKFPLILFMCGVVLCCAVVSHSVMFYSVTPWTVAHQAPLSWGFSRQEHWRGLPSPPPGDLPNPGIEPASLVCPALADGSFTISAGWEALMYDRSYEK